MPWRTLSTTSPKREFYIPYEEKLQQIITKAEKGQNNDRIPC